MKKKLLISILMVSLVGTMSLVGCSSEDIDNTNNNTNQSQNTSEDSDKNILSNIENEEKENDEKEEADEELAMLRLYYYDASNDVNYSIDSPINVKDKAIVTSLISALKEIPTGTSIDKYRENIMSLPKDITVLSAKVNNDLDTLTVDFNSHISEGLGSTAETSLIHTIVNTLGYNLKVSNVEITINGEPYSSGHIVQEKGESFPVNISNTISLEK